MSDEEKKLAPEFLCSLNSFYECGDRGYRGTCDLKVTTKYSKAASSCEYRILAKQIETLESVIDHV